MLSRPAPARTSSLQSGRRGQHVGGEHHAAAHDDGVAVGDRLLERIGRGCGGRRPRRTTAEQDLDGAGVDRARQQDLHALFAFQVDSMAATTSDTAASSGRSTSTTTNSGTTRRQLQILLPDAARATPPWPRACGRGVPRPARRAGSPDRASGRRARASSRAAAGPARDGVRPRRRRGSSRGRSAGRRPRSVRAALWPRATSWRSHSSVIHTAMRAVLLTAVPRPEAHWRRLRRSRHAGCWPPGRGARRARASPRAAGGWSGASACWPPG